MGLVFGGEIALIAHKRTLIGVGHGVLVQGSLENETPLKKFRVYSVKFGSKIQNFPLTFHRQRIEKAFRRCATGNGPPDLPCSACEMCIPNT